MVNYLLTILSRTLYKCRESTFNMFKIVQFTACGGRFQTQVRRRGASDVKWTSSTIKAALPSELLEYFSVNFLMVI